MKRVLLAALTCSLCLLCSCASEYNAGVLPLTWPYGEVTYRFLDPSDGPTDIGHRPIRVPIAWDEDRKRHAREAWARWEVAGAGRLRVREVPPSAPAGVDMVLVDDYPGGYDGLEQEEGDYTTGVAKRCVIQVRHSLERKYWHFIFVHEEGHALGLPHTTDPGAVMNHWGDFSMFWSHLNSRPTGTVERPDRIELWKLYPTIRRAPAPTGNDRQESAPTGISGDTTNDK